MEEKKTARETLSLRFPKGERLGHPTLISALFEKGKSEYAYPLRMTWRLLDAADIPPQLRGHRLRLMVNAPKKRFKRAVKRVRLRRLMREAWRLQRLPLRQKLEERLPGKILHVALLYMAPQMASYARIEAKVARLLDSLDTALFPEDHIEKPAEKPAEKNDGKAPHSP